MERDIAARENGRIKEFVCNSLKAVPVVGLEDHSKPKVVWLVHKLVRETRRRRVEARDGTIKCRKAVCVSVAHVRVFHSYFGVGK